MAGSPAFKVYDSRKVYQASTKEVEAAAALVTFYGPGSTIRYDHGSVLWTEGSETFNAAAGYDLVKQTVYERLAKVNHSAYERVHGRVPVYEGK